MTIHRQTLTLTVYSINPVDSTVLADNFKEAIRHHGAVVDVEQESAAILTTDAGQLELWDRGFDPDVLDGYNDSLSFQPPNNVLWAIDVMGDERENRSFPHDQRH